MIYLSVYYVSKNPYRINKIQIVIGLLAGSMSIFQLIIYSWKSIGLSSLYIGWPLLAAVYFLVLLGLGIKTNAEQKP